ncbi:hypothetical protein SALBM311S_03612 [Streptomyces alboniger]
MSYRERYAVTYGEDRKPQSDEAKGVFDSEITSEFALPDGLAVPKAGAESEPTSEFAMPDGLDVPQSPAAEPEGSAFSPPRTYSSKHAPPAFTPPSGIPVVSLIKDLPWQDRMRTMLRMPVAERPAPEPAHKSEEDEGPAVPRVLDLTLRIGELLLAGGEGSGGRRGGDVRGLPVVRPGPLRAERHLHAAGDLVPAVPGGRPGDGLPDRAPPGHRLHASGGRVPAGGRPQRHGDGDLPGGGLPAARPDPPEPAPVPRLGADRGERSARGRGLRAGRR